MNLHDFEMDVYSGGLVQHAQPSTLNTSADGFEEGKLTTSRPLIVCFHCEAGRLWSEINSGEAMFLRSKGDFSMCPCGCVTVPGLLNSVNICFHSTYMRSLNGQLIKTVSMLHYASIK